jgi:hypothetical protein
MYSGQLDAAKKIYIEGLNATDEIAVRWQNMILKDFAELSEHRLQHPLMAEIKREMETVTKRADN